MGYIKYTGRERNRLTSHGPYAILTRTIPGWGGTGGGAPRDDGQQRYERRGRRLVRGTGPILSGTVESRGGVVGFRGARAPRDLGTSRTRGKFHVILSGRAIAPLRGFEGDHPWSS